MCYGATMLRRRPPTKYVEQASVRITREALEGASVLPVQATAQGVFGLDIGTMGDSPEEARAMLVKALRRLGNALISEAEKYDTDTLVRYTGGLPWYEVPNVWHGEDLPVRLCPRLMSPLDGTEHKAHNWRLPEEEAASYCPGEVPGA